jgi:hypothetical protein
MVDVDDRTPGMCQGGLRLSVLFFKCSLIEALIFYG